MKNIRIAVVGAGCSGIAAVKALKSAGFTSIVCFEQNDRVGGNWIYSADPSHSSIIDTTHIISSKKLSEYSDFPMPDDYPDYPSHQQVLAYFESYAKYFDLYPYIKFNTPVKTAKLNENNKWIIESKDGAEEFDYLLIANGHHSDPRHPQLPGKFSGEYIHAHSFKNNKKFKDKSVLVIGGGNSACDCAVEASRVAKKTWISMRRAHYIVPKFLLGKPTDTFNKRLSWIPDFIANPLRKTSLRIQIGKYEDYGLKTPKFPVTRDHPTLNSELLYKLRHGNVKAKPGIKHIEGKTVLFEDDTQIEVDTIIAATGYKISTPFLDKSILDYSNADRIPLYLRMFNADYKNLIFIGLVQPQGAVWPLSEVQSVLAAEYIKGNYQLPNNLEVEIEKECSEIEKEFLKRKRHTIEVHYHDYLNKIKKLIPKQRSVSV